MCLALVACGAGSDSLPIETRDIPVRVPSKTHAPVGPITGMHGSPIALIAPADHGDTVITADTDGAMRLWPTLDGTREPIVVTGQRPRALAVARDDAGFTIANQDAAQGVEIVRLDLRGAVTSRTVLPQEPVAVEVAVAAAGVIVLRADQAIEVVAPDGTVRARLVAEPGTRIETVVVREGRALAIIITGAQVRGRWIDLAGATPAWGETTPVLELDPAFPIALSPDHATLLATSKLSREASVLVELATGMQRGDAICVGSRMPRSKDRPRAPGRSILAHELVAADAGRCVGQVLPAHRVRCDEACGSPAAAEPPAGDRARVRPGDAAAREQRRRTNILLRFDPVTHSFTERLELDKAHQLRSVHLLDPALSGGLVALTIEDLDGALTIGEIHGDDLRHGITSARRARRCSGAAGASRRCRRARDTSRDRTRRRAVR
jgi:hypothetical protein